MYILNSDILRRCIVEQISRMMVLPNKLPIKLSDEVPTVDLRMPEPEVSFNTNNFWQFDTNTNLI